MTEGYRAWDYCPFLGRYKLKSMLSPLRLSNLSRKTPIRQLRETRTTNNTNTETEVEAEAESEAKSEVEAEAESEGQVWDPAEVDLAELRLILIRF